MYELVTRLWECASGECFNCSQYTPTTNASVCQKELMKQAADAIEELVGFAQEAERDRDEYRERLDKANDAIEGLTDRNVGKWIPVTERLPEAGERVLCYCRANIYEVMKMRTDGDWVYDTNHVYMHSFVTHWIPLPEPPKEET